MRPHTARKLSFVRESVCRARSLFIIGAWARERSAGATIQPSEKKETLTFWTITAAIGLPMILAVALVGLDMRADLSELKPAELNPASEADKGVSLVGWPDLKGLRESPARVRMLGYMLDDLRRPHEGNRADIFILLPEAGQFLHPAHRIPDQSVVVWPTYPVVFRYRQLVWVTGVLSRALRSPGDDLPAWAMTFADMSPADERDIGRWFRP